MKISAKNHPQSGFFFRNLDPDCCNLQSGRKLSSLIYIGFPGKSRLRIPDCGESPQSGIYPNKSTTYENFQIAGNPFSLRERGKPRLRGITSCAVLSMMGGSGGTV
jgi:hypothetical protein